MKKVKLTTVTLALLAGSVVAPIVSTAAGVEKTQETTETVQAANGVEVEGTIEKESKTQEEATPKAETPKVETKAAEVDPNAELNSAIEVARNEAYARHIAGDITYDAYIQLDQRILACQSVEEVNNMIKYMNDNLNAELAAARENAHREIDELLRNYKISQANRDAYVNRVYASGTQAEIDAVLVEARAEAALFDAKLAAKASIQDLVDGYGFTDEDAIEFFNKVDFAKSEAEVNGVVSEATQAAELGGMRYDAKVQLWDLKLAETITQDEYFVYANQIDAATTQSEIDSILAAAAEFVDLKEYKKEAYYKLSELVHEGKLSMDDYTEFMDELDAATNKAEVDQMLANAQTRVQLNEAKEAAKAKVLELAHAEKINSGEYWTAVRAIDAATTIEEVNAALAEAQAIADLKDAKEAAIRATDAHLNKGAITLEQRDAFVTRIDAATSVEEVNSIMAEVEAAVALNEAKELAKDVILDLAHAELIDSGEYWDFVNAIDAATSIEEVNSIIDEASELAALRQAQKDAKDELFSMLVTGDLVMADYYHYVDLVENAKSAEEVTEIMADANALVLARETAAAELDGLYKEGFLTLVETNGFQYQMEDVRTAEEVEAIMQEARDLANSRRVAEVTESTVTVHYVDENGKSIKDSESTTKNVGEKHVFEAATIAGYELQGPSSLELTFSDSPQTITFTYAKVEEAKKEGNITVQYLDKDGKEVKESEKLTKKIGTKEIIEAPAVKGYKVVGPSALKVEFVEIDQTVAFTYEKVSEDKVTDKEDNKKEDNKKATNKKDELPQTGEAAANAGLVAGGILSMLSAAFVFLRKGK
ncbi:MucBP domain-containing protein [Vagococcus fluvialis]|uniref:MucBP domain-containing protein n=1 Tax=Vagococcus fluvialis TaxID=2738 RepID=UPI003D0BF6E7